MSEQNMLQDNIRKEIVELSDSINEIISNYKRLRNPLAETQKKVPKATKHLDKINEQTEAAAHQMLDMVEKITERAEETVEGLKEVKNKVVNDKSNEIMTIIDALIDKASTTCNDAFSIMDILQFQDITSQQLNNAVVLLEELEKKINKILAVLYGKDCLKMERKPEKNKVERAFDPNADLFEKKTNQEDIDSLFGKKSKTL